MLDVETTDINLSNNSIVSIGREEKRKVTTGLYRKRRNN